MPQKGDVLLTAKESRSLNEREIGEKLAKMQVLLKLCPFWRSAEHDSRSHKLNGGSEFGKLLWARASDSISLCCAEGYRDKGVSGLISSVATHSWDVNAAAAAPIGTSFSQKMASRELHQSANVIRMPVYRRRPRHLRQLGHPLRLTVFFLRSRSFRLTSSTSSQCSFPSHCGETASML
jgi:hypothetical protein